MTAASAGATQLGLGAGKGVAGKASLGKVAGKFAGLSHKAALIGGAVVSALPEALLKLVLREPITLSKLVKTRTGMNWVWLHQLLLRPFWKPPHRTPHQMVWSQLKPFSARRSAITTMSLMRQMLSS